MLSNQRAGRAAQQLGHEHARPRQGQVHQKVGTAAITNQLAGTAAIRAEKMPSREKAKQKKQPRRPSGGGETWYQELAAMHSMKGITMPGQAKANQTSNLLAHWPSITQAGSTAQHTNARLGKGHGTTGTTGSQRQQGARYHKLAGTPASKAREMPGREKAKPKKQTRRPSGGVEQWYQGPAAVHSTKGITMPDEQRPTT